MIVDNTQHFYECFVLGNVDISIESIIIPIIFVATQFPVAKKMNAKM